MATKIRIKATEEPVTPVIRNKSPLDTTADVRDLLSGLVGGGFTKLSEGDAGANFGRLRNILGPQKANELLAKVLVYNQSPENKALPVEARIQRFYDTQKNDPVINKARTFGYGVLPGFRESPNALNQQLQGKLPMATTASIDPEIGRKIMLKINK